jgi:hypothetical protein
MQFKINSDATQLRTERDGMPHPWVEITPDEWRHELTAADKLIFGDWLSEKRSQLFFFDEANDGERRTIEFVTGEKDPNGEARGRGDVIEYKAEDGRALTAKLVLTVHGDDNEIAPGCRVYLTPQGIPPIRAYIDLACVNTVDDAERVFATLRELERELRSTRAWAGYYKNSQTSSLKYVCYDDVKYTPRSNKI